MIKMNRKKMLHEKEANGLSFRILNQQDFSGGEKEENRYDKLLQELKIALSNSDSDDEN